jgi:hypothetical protein
VGGPSVGVLSTLGRRGRSTGEEDSS